MRSMVLYHLACSLLVSQLAPAQRTGSVPYQDARLSVEQRTENLLQRMTTEEKIGQLQCWIGSLGVGDTVATSGVGGLAVTLRSLSARAAAERANQLQRLAVEETRLGIPLLIHDEALHGLIGKGATSFPQAIALAATWDPELMARVATVIGRQTRSRGIRQVLSPVVNVVRDARWGRVEETYGEDPYLSARMGVAFCKPIELQGVITTPKHFVANVGDGGRDSHPIELSETQLREIYFPPFQACIQEGGARSIMSSYNSVNGLPASANRWLLTDVLRKEWGFRGFVVSDYGSELNRRSQRGWMWSFHRSISMVSHSCRRSKTSVSLFRSSTRPSGASSGQNSSLVCLTILMLTRTKPRGWTTRRKIACLRSKPRAKASFS